MMISRNFGPNEFECHDGTPVPQNLLSNLSKLVHTVLQPIRDEWALPLIVVSGYRTEAWNQRVGGAKESTHVSCLGADIRPVHLRDCMKLYDTVLSMYNRSGLAGLGGLGMYPNWVHVDARIIPGRLRQWKGRGVGSEPLG